MGVQQKRTESFQGNQTVSFHNQDVEHFLTHFTQLLMKSGKKSKAFKTLRVACDHLCQSTRESLAALCPQLLEQVTPSFGLRSVRIGGTNIQVPFLLHTKAAHTQGLRWIIEGAKKRHGKLRVQSRPGQVADFSACLAAEMKDALQLQGFAVSQRRDRHKRALANRQYSHYARW